MQLVGRRVKRRRPLECQPGLPFNRINAWIWSERTHTRWTVIKNPSGKDLNEILGWGNKLGFQAELEKDSGSLFSASSHIPPFLQPWIGFGEKHFFFFFYMWWISETWNYPLLRRDGVSLDTGSFHGRAGHLQSAFLPWCCKTPPKHLGEWVILEPLKKSKQRRKKKTKQKTAVGSALTGKLPILLF